MQQEFTDNFIGDKKIQGKVIMSLGTKGSGKTHCLTQYLKLCLKNKVYDAYYLVLPAYMIEANDTYKFLKPHKNVVIMTGYMPDMTEKLMNSIIKAKKRGKNPRTLYAIDDSSAEELDHNKMDEAMKKFITSIRHYHTDLFLVTHATNSCMSPFLRGQVDIMLLYKMTNYKLMKIIFEEFLSLTYGKNEKGFITEYKDLMKKPYECLYINLRNQEIFKEFKSLTDKFNI
jgi:hypothetical protein